MARQLLIGALAIIGFFGLVWLLIGLWNPKIDVNTLDGISVETEDVLGELIFETILEDPGMDILEDQKTDSLLRIIVQPVLENSPPGEFDFKFYILDDPMVNAFAIPGGRIFIGAGLIALVESQEEFLAVVGHEMGHVNERHVMEKLAREFGIKVLISMSTGTDAILLSDIGSSLVSLGFDRQAEREADEFALELLVNCGIHPHHMATFFRRLNRENLSYAESLEFMMSHPHNNARIKSALEYPVPEDFEPVEYGDSWDSFKSQFRELAG